MTYQELLEELQNFNEEQLKSEVSVYIRDLSQSFPVCDAIYLATTEDEEGRITQTNQPYLML